MNETNEGIGFGVSRGALVAMIVLAIIVILTAAGVLPAHGSTEVEPGEVVVCAVWEGEWTASVHTVEEAAGILAALPGSFILDMTAVPTPSIDGAGCESQADPTPTTAPPATATAKPNPSATTPPPTVAPTVPPTATQPAPTGTAPPPATPTATAAPPTATPVPPAPACPFDDIGVTVSITGAVHLWNSKATAVGPLAFAISVTTDTGAWEIVSNWAVIARPRSMGAYAGQAFYYWQAGSTGNFRAMVIPNAAPQCAPFEAGRGVQLWFPVAVTR